MRGRDCGEETRGVTPQVGFVLLIGLVVTAVAIIFIIASGMLAGLEGDIDREQLRSTIDVVDSDISTVAFGGGSRELPEYGHIEATNESTIAVTWHGEDDPGDLSEADFDNETDVGELHLYPEESRSDNLRYLYQAGGIWEITDSGTILRTEPDIGFTADDSLRLNIVQIDPGEIGGTPSRVSGVETAMTENEELARIANNPEDEHFAIRIETEYADEWYDHLENEEADTELDVDISEPENGAVVLTIDNISKPQDGPNFIIDEYHGMESDAGTPLEGDDRIVEKGEHFYVNTTIKNIGNESDIADVEIEISNETWTNSTTVTSDDEIDEDETINTTNNGNWSEAPQIDPEELGLSPGAVYEYDVDTGDESLDTRGSFVYATDEFDTSVEDLEVETTDETVNITAAIQNTGNDDGETNVTVDIHNSSMDMTHENLSLGETESKNVSWTIPAEDWPNDEYEFTVRTDEDEDGKLGEFTIEDGYEPNLLVTDDLGIDGGNEVQPSDSVTIGANITNTHVLDQNETVDLEFFHNQTGEAAGGNGTTVEVPGATTKTANLTVPPANHSLSVDGDETVYDYDIITLPDDPDAGDSLEERGSFLVVGGPETTVEIESVDDPVKPGEELAVTATIDNYGNAGSQYLWLEGFDDNIVDVGQVELEEGEETTETFVWDEVAPPSGDDSAVTVHTPNDDASEEVGIDPVLEVTDVSVSDDPAEYGDWVTVSADLESVGGQASQTVVLEGLESETTTRSVDVSGSEEIIFEYEVPDGAMTDRVTVSTDDDQMDEVVVVERDGPICGQVSYDGSGTSSNPYQIHNVDELQCINEHDLDAHYELAGDIDAHGTEYWNGGAGFEPIGPEGHNYPNTYVQSDRYWELGHEPFSGSFDGNGHVIDGLTIDRPNEDFVGLFGATSYTQDFHPDNGNWVEPGDGSLIENVRLTNVSVVGNQHVGGLAGQAGGTVLNARSDGYVEGQEQLVGGLIGDGAHADMDNRLVAAGTVEGGEIDPDENHYNAQLNHEGIGGLVGRATWNTRVSVAYTQTDVTGDKYVGAVIGTSSYIDSEFEQLYTSGTATADSSDGGAIVGTVLSEGDEFEDSVYWDETVESSAYGEAGNWYTDVNINWVQTDWNGRDTEQMTGLEVNQGGRMGNLEFEEDGGEWVAIPEDYPRFAWELEAEGAFEVEIDDVDNATAGEFVEVNVTVTSLYRDSEEADITQNIVLTDPDGQTVDSQPVTLSSTLDEDETDKLTLVWETDESDVGTGTVVASSEDDEDTALAEVTEPEYDHGTGEPSDDPTELPDLPGEEDPSDGEPVGPGDAQGPDGDTPIDIGFDPIVVE
ncbi:hypothetical protein D8Y22_12685 [Salinadaptatus halalkaliphilus]|uniref:Uncharacterized protein n=1 Tax=Salinadaptatus halalkaliphilus TaxID=2419781 RepID=A0A4S3TK65_9EURY|nr:hypothetical protein [Salinadaptatus halalkaliphilus]THE64494.1 hypothetical protein D8Y22_12685 [Salinadaptatus halalkaliphilus]